jgi:hypothetical protein
MLNNKKQIFKKNVSLDLTIHKKVLTLYGEKVLCFIKLIFIVSVSTCFLLLAET